MFQFRYLNFPGLFFNADGGGGSGTGDDGKGDDKSSPKTVTIESQEKLDAMFAERAKQGGRSALDELFKTLGVKDADELKTFLVEGKKLKESQLSELEKANSDKKFAEDALAAEKDAHAKTKQAFIERLLKAEIQSEAKKAGFRDESLGDVWMLVKAEHREKITEKDDAFQGVDKVVEEIKKAKPFWLGETQTKKKSLGSPRQPLKNGDGSPTPIPARPTSRL